MIMLPLYLALALVSQTELTNDAVPDFVSRITELESRIEIRPAPKRR